MKLAFSGGKQVAIVLSLGLVGLVAACGGDDTVSTGIGGSSGSGGSSAGTGGKGGSAGAGGSVGTGGSTGTGGANGTGGSTGTGGSAGASGNTGTGGSAGSGGADGGGTGGRAGADGGVTPDATADAPAFTPKVLFTFDLTEAGDAGTYGWTADPGSTLELVNDDRDPANTTPGALRLTANFPPYNDAGASGNVSTTFVFGDPNTGTNKTLNGGTHVHFWLRLVSAPAPSISIDHHQPFIQGGGASNYGNQYGFFANSTLPDNNWHEFVLDVSASYNVVDIAPFMADVWRVGLQLIGANRPAPPVNDGGTSSVDGGGEASTSDAATVSDAAVSDANLDGGVSTDVSISTDATVDGASTPDTGSGTLIAPPPVVIDIDYIWVE